MVAMKNVSVGDDISGKIYTGVAMMDEEPESSRVVVVTKTEKYLFDLDDPNVIMLDEGPLK